MNSKKKNKFTWTKYVSIIIFFAICFVVGIKIGKEIGANVKMGKSLGDEVAVWVVRYLIVFVAAYVHIIIHEAGHLFFGRMSGYEFVSFRIMSFMWIKQNGKINFKRMKLVGTGGQCLMAPPPLKDGKIPFILFNLGGSLMNFIASGVSLCLLIFVIAICILLNADVDTEMFTFVVVAFAMLGIIMGLSNIIPIKKINNDGYNTMELRKSNKAVYAFWLQLMMNAEIANGKRISDMPDEWFEVPSDEEMKNSLVSSIGVFASNKLMIERKFEEADGLMEHMLEIESGLPEVYRHLLMCDRIYCEIIGENRHEVIDEMYKKQLKQFMYTMKKFPTVIRTQYVYALCVEKNENKAADILKYYDKCMKSYPYPVDAEMERELMMFAKEKWNNN